MPQKHSFKQILKDNNVTNVEELYIDDIVLNLKDLWKTRNNTDENKMNSFICAVFMVMFDYLGKEEKNG